MFQRGSTGYARHLSDQTGLARCRCPLRSHLTLIAPQRGVKFQVGVFKILASCPVEPNERMSHAPGLFMPPPAQVSGAKHAALQAGFSFSYLRDDLPW